MPQGLQVWDENGTLIIDTSTSIMKTLSASIFTASGSTTITPVANTSAIPLIKPDYSYAGTNAAAKARMSGNNINVWVPPSNTGSFRTRMNVSIF